MTDDQTFTIGILGAGQLGRMLALAGIPLGYAFRFLDPGDGGSVAGLGELVSGDYLDDRAVARFAEGCDRITFEFENVPASAVEVLARTYDVAPSCRALEASQDRWIEKQFFASLGIATAETRPIGSLPEFTDAARALGLPAVLKTRRHGYDGKGQALVRQSSDIEPAWHAIGERPAVLEALVPFDRELSILAVRGRDGAIAFYPLVQNHHDDGILRLSIAPIASPRLQEQAEGMAAALLRALDYVGVLALELFECKGRLLANEMAPRVHNSGHWTIEGAETSQFENHLRAIAGLPLGSTAPRGASTMVNLVGVLPPAGTCLDLPGVHLHRYGKEVRPARKVGHLTVTGIDASERDQRTRRLLAALPEAVTRHLPPAGPAWGPDFSPRLRGEQC